MSGTREGVHPQLTLPFTRERSSTPVISVPLGCVAPPSWRARLALGPRAVVVSLARTKDGARLALDAQQDGPGAWSVALDLRVRPILTSTIQSDSPEPLHWALSRRVPGGDPHEFFPYALRWAARKLAGETLCRGRLLAVEAGLRPVLRDAARGMLDALDPAVVAAARRFAPGTRTRVASALSRDRGGWLRDAARAHPGLLLFALALLDAGETEDAGLTLLHDLGHGRRLAPALDAAVGAWAAALPAWAGQPDLWDPAVRATFAAAAEAGPGSRARMIAAQRLLVRRAGPWCDPALLLLPPPVRFAPEDVPAPPRENAAWYRVMKLPGVTVRRGGMWAHADVDDAFAAFASRHAVALARVPRGVALEVWLAELRGALRGAGRTPSRATDPARVIRDVNVRELRARVPAAPGPAVPLVPREARDRRGGGHPVETLAAPPPAPRLPPGSPITPHRFPPFASERASVVQVVTYPELRAEALRQHNCVRTYLEDIRAGRTVVFSARVDGNPITIAIEPWMSGFRLKEVKGFGNRRVTASEREALAPWCEANRIEDPAAP